MYLKSYYNPPKISIDITTSRSLELSTCFLFISFLRAVNRAQSLNNNYLLLFLATAFAAVVFATYIITLTSTNALL